MVITRRSFLYGVAMLTGSAAFGVATNQSDEDWLWIDDGSDPPADWFVDGEASYYKMYGFSSYRNGSINLIVPHSRAFRDKWLEAHRHCMIERPRERARRIKIFRHYLYGELL